MCVLRATAIMLAWLALSAPIASAGYVYIDYDANQNATLAVGIPDPEAFGWLDVYAPGNGAPVVNDAGLQVNAWQIIDGVGSLPNPSYLSGLDSQVSEDAVQDGFRFEAVARFAGESSAPSLGIGLLLNQREYHLLFNITTEGDLQATLLGRPGVTQLTTGGTGRWAYHRFSLESAGGGSTSVSAMFDGQPIGAPWGGIGGQPGHADLVMFGSSNRAGNSTGAMAYKSLKFEVGPIAEIPADADGDSDVDGFDFITWQRTLGSRTQLAADSNHDCIVNAGDLSHWRQQFGMTSSESAATNVRVPEPPSAALELIAALLGVLCPRLRRMKKGGTSTLGSAPHLLNVLAATRLAVDAR